MENFPPISNEIITALDKLYPERSASIGETMDQIMFRAGQRQVVRFLLAQFDEQNRTILTDRIAPNGNF